MQLCYPVLSLKNLPLLSLPIEKKKNPKPLIGHSCPPELFKSETFWLQLTAIQHICLSEKKNVLAYDPGGLQVVILQA